MYRKTAQVKKERNSIQPVQFLDIDIWLFKLSHKKIINEVNLS